jgi:hypothetical protein
MRHVLVIISCIFLASCGLFDGGDGVEYRKTTKKPTDQVEPTTWEDIKPLVAEHCGSCHANPPRVKITASSWEAARARVEAGTMPPNGKLPPEVLKAFLSYGAG